MSMIEPELDFIDIEQHKYRSLYLDLINGFSIFLKPVQQLIFRSLHLTLHPDTQYSFYLLEPSKYFCPYNIEAIFQL
jgi:hypothetical protein